MTHKIISRTQAIDELVQHSLLDGIDSGEIEWMLRHGCQGFEEYKDADLTLIWRDTFDNVDTTVLS